MGSIRREKPGKHVCIHAHPSAADNIGLAATRSAGPVPLPLLIMHVATFIIE